jgi:hypothetical protein
MSLGVGVISDSGGFKTAWAVSGPFGITQLPANIQAIYNAGIADGTYVDAVRVFYERPAAWVSFDYFSQGHAQLPDPSNAYDFPAQPMVRQYTYPCDAMFMGLMPAAMKVANPAYGSASLRMSRKPALISWRWFLSRYSGCSLHSPIT